jgi:cytidylate kinase
MAIITISRQYGSGGDEIADQVCQILGYRHFDKRDIARAAARAGFSEEEIATYKDYSEENFRVKNFLSRLMRRSSPSVSHKEDSLSVRLAEEKVFNEASALMLVRKAVETACSTGDTIVVGRGGQMILRDETNVLHIRIEAPLDVRIRRVEGWIRQDQPANEPVHDLWHNARDLIAERDSASADYVRMFYGADWANPALYHAVLNLGKMDTEQAAQIVVDMVNRLFPAGNEILGNKTKT